MTAQPDHIPSDPYQQLKERIHLRLKEAHVNDRIFGVVKDACTELLRTENIILSRAENNRLLRDILMDVLAEMRAEL